VQGKNAIITLLKHQNGFIEQSNYDTLFVKKN